MGCKVLLPPGRRRCVQCRRGAKTGSNSINLRRGKKCSAAAAVCAMIYGGHRWRGQGTNLFIVRITFYYQVVRRGSPSPPETLSGVSTLARLVSVYQQMRSGAPLPLLLIHCVGAVTPSASRTGDSDTSLSAAMPHFKQDFDCN